MASEDILILALIVALYNVVVFCVYWWDKNAARDGTWRVRESTLLTLAFLAGSPAALLARKILRHKTRKQPFASNLNGIAWLHAIMIAAGAIFAMTPAAIIDMVLNLISTAR
ncbi:DUF1294 domain-containing protein [Agrobacterium sp. a22-2]|uniref:DUF1294 domain-containing protein n=1 Tax=Agrobacterium sp. a22-2 TaxID=2283840 RepID=UPI001445D444|nr:DUF1294 domain-containing protein [Agrobacterium sp. a22-2]NKN36747.1 DUF1294 domain-containing protein [Agrobacterium sp. a22-2]